MSFRLAVPRDYYNSKGKVDTDFVSIVAFGSVAEQAGELLRRGSVALIWGKLQVRSYDKQGMAQWMTEVLLDNFQLLHHAGAIVEKKVLV